MRSNLSRFLHIRSPNSVDNYFLYTVNRSYELIENLQCYPILCLVSSPNPHTSHTHTPTHTHTSHTHTYTHVLTQCYLKKSSIFSRRLARSYHAVGYPAVNTPSNYSQIKVFPARIQPSSIICSSTLSVSLPLSLTITHIHPLSLSLFPSLSGIHSG